MLKKLIEISFTVHKTASEKHAINLYIVYNLKQRLLIVTNS